jgi:hypothetical protein
MTLIIYSLCARSALLRVYILVIGDDNSYLCFLYISQYFSIVSLKVSSCELVVAKCFP